MVTFQPIELRRIYMKNCRPDRGDDRARGVPPALRREPPLLDDIGPSELLRAREAIECA